MTIHPLEKEFITNEELIETQTDEIEEDLTTEDTTKDSKEDKEVDETKDSSIIIDADGLHRMH